MQVDGFIADNTLMDAGCFMADYIFMGCHLFGFSLDNIFMGCKLLGFKADNTFTWDASCLALRQITLS